MMTRLLFTVLISLTAIPAFAVEPGDPSALAIPPQVAKRAGELIVILGGKDADKRNDAYMELDKLGRQALPAIEAALKGKLDAELRTNLERLRGPAMKEQFQAAYKIFLADKNNKYQHDFPGWNQLVAAAKDNKDSRKLMRDILSEKDTPEFFAIVCSDRDRALLAIDERWFKLGLYRVKVQRLDQDLTAPAHDYKSIKVHSFAAILLAECLMPGEIQNPSLKIGGEYERGAGFSIRTEFFRGLGLSKPVNDECVSELRGQGKYGDVYTTLCKHWIKTRTTPAGLYAAKRMCEEFQFNDLLIICWERTLETPNIPSGVITIAMDHLVKTGDRKYIKEFKKHFANESKSSSYLLEVDKAEVRDHALLFCLFLTNQKPSEFGYSYQFEKLPDQNDKVHERICFNYLFRTDDAGTVDEKRKKAFSKWAEWEKTNIIK